MAGNTNVLRYDPNNCSERVGNFLTRLAPLKGLHLQRGAIECDRAPTVIIRGFTLGGIWPIINHLQRICRDPVLYPVGAVNQNDCALFDDAIDGILHYDQDLDALLSYYTHHNPDRVVSIPRQQLTLLDVAVAACTDAIVEHPWVHEVQKQLDHLGQRYLRESTGVT